jgi:predicted nucleic acid-binding protein
VKRIRTFIDASLLIAAARGNQAISDRALELLDNPGRAFITSDFVCLEVLPKAVFYRQQPEIHFYRAFFARAQRTVKASSSLVAQAEKEAEQAGLSAVDALHVAAAKKAKCHELITAEKPDKPLFRVRGLTIQTIRS